jgi:hypothetical protein
LRQRPDRCRLRRGLRSRPARNGGPNTFRRCSSLGHALALAFALALALALALQVRSGRRGMLTYFLLRFQGPARLTSTQCFGSSYPRRCVTRLSASPTRAAVVAVVIHVNIAAVFRRPGKCTRDATHSFER